MKEEAVFENLPHTINLEQHPPFSNSEGRTPHYMCVCVYHKRLAANPRGDREPQSKK